ncbi:MAG: S-layer homology domain-containing protein [Gudongella sp.]|nr:S-layer homology domain-containing protein [Gudongella sp.]
MKYRLLLFMILVIMLPSTVIASDFSIGVPKQVSVEIQDSTSDSFILKWKEDLNISEMALKDEYKGKVFTQVNVYIRAGDKVNTKDLTFKFDGIQKNSEGLYQIVLTPDQIGIETQNIDLMGSSYSFKIRHGIRMQDILGSFSILGGYSPSTSIGLIYPYNYASQWAIEELNQAVNSGLLIDDIKSNMKETITREEFSALMVNLYEKTTNDIIVFNEVPFIDTSNPDISKAFELGIVSGYEDKTFRPRNPITRQDIAVIMMRTLKKIDTSLDTAIYPSQNNEGIKEYAYDSMIFLNQKQIFKGDENGKLNPFTLITREQSVLLVLRAFDTFIEE